VDVLCPGCLTPQPLAGFCAQCGVVLAPEGIACTAVLGAPSPARVSLRGTKNGDAFVVRLQRLTGDNPEAQRKRAKQLARFAEVPDVVAWSLAGIAQRDGAAHWVLTRRWVEGTGLGTLCATAHPATRRWSTTSRAGSAPSTAPSPTAVSGCISFITPTTSS
jgi:hypothetical protein